ncbi:MAG: heparinase II/III family protein, partial [Methylacidiphilales bacterium]|nr:heparinase II/III family protein [Candidatus Methylacidiphilales bacterium]
MTPHPVSPGPVTTDDEIIADLNLDAPGLEKVKAAIQTGDIPAAQAAYLDYRRTASPAKWKITPADEPAAPTETDDPVGDAICKHLLSNRYFRLGSPPPAQIDVGKDFNWKYNPLPPSDPAYTSLWAAMMDRTPWWDDLAKAYWQTRNEKYAVEWVTELRDFARKNPVPPGTTGMWAPPSLWVSLDVGIRMSDPWPNAYYHFLNSPSFTPADNWLYLKLVRDHAIRLLTGLKVSPDRSGNWVILECSGLYTAGVLFPELREAAAWRQFAVDRMLLEMKRMVPPDGFEAELTPGYHMTVAKGFRSSLELAKLNKLPISEAFQSKVIAMYRALVLVMDQEGNDVPTNDSTLINARYEAKTGLEIADDPLLEWAASGGKSGTAPPDSTMLPYAGFYAMRGGWKPNDLFLFFRAGPPGIGHEHQDMLEITLNAWGKTLLFDAGRYTYDQSDWRRFSNGTASHNTIIVDGKWQHRPKNKVPVPPVSNPWVTTPLFDYVAATYDAGYQQSVYKAQQYDPQRWVGEVDKSVSHTRRVLFLRPYYALVLDTLDGTGDHTFDAHFHMDAPAAHLDLATQAAF